MRKVTIGYALNLDTQMIIYMAERNAQRALFGYVTTYLNLPVTVRSMMRLGSWASYIQLMQGGQIYWHV
jgi:hypothetical protein